VNELNLVATLSIWGLLLSPMPGTNQAGEINC
jgi:hypothetical protein